jgi:protoheme IX farnesyltransferase
MKEWMRVLFELTKFKISIFLTLSTMTGFILARSGVSIKIIPMLAGVFLLASGSCGLNQFQEREYDQRMERTRTRPIPSKRITPIVALKISLLLILLGGVIIFNGTNGIAFALSVFALVWYHFVYTPLKKVTAFAVIPGALIGSIPPVIGWISGGGQLSDPPILFLSFLFYIWQVPHCWILQCHFGKDYEKGGFPTLARTFTPSQFGRILFIWVFSMGASCFLIPIFDLLRSPVILGGLFSIGGGLLWKSYKILISRHQGWNGPAIFRTINIYLFLILTGLLLDRFLSDQIHCFLF